MAKTPSPRVQSTSWLTRKPLNLEVPSWLHGTGARLFELVEPLRRRVADMGLLGARPYGKILIIKVLV